MPRQKPSVEQRATDYGYSRDDALAIINYLDDVDLVRVGEKTKPGDEYWAGAYHGWTPLADEYVHITIAWNWQPVRRKKQWACRHARLQGEKFCPVCAAFFRHVDEVW